MTSTDTVGVVLAAIQDRRSAMLHSDTRALAKLLDDRLVYTHSTGVKDDKSALLGKLERGELVYVALDLDADEVRLHAQTAVVVGRMTATVIVKGQERSLSTRTLEVFLLAPEGWKLEAFQSTAAPS